MFADDYVKLKTECFHTQVVSSTFKFLFHGYLVKSNLNKSCHFPIRGINTSRGFQLKKTDDLIILQIPGFLEQIPYSKAFSF